MDAVDSWLVKMAAKQPTDVARLESAMSEMSINDLVKLAQESQLQEQRSQTEEFLEKVAAADRMGRELAHKHGAELLAQVVGQEKTAFTITERGHKHDAEKYHILARQAAERAAFHEREGGLVTNKSEGGHLGNLLRFGPDLEEGPHGARPDAMARHHEYAAKQHEQGSNAWNPFGGMLTPSSYERGGVEGFLGSYGKPGATLPSPPKAPAKEKQAGVLSSLGGLAQKATAAAVRHPTAALGVAGGAVGAGVGAATAKPGEGLSGALKGGVMGAGLGAGAGALGAGQALRKGVLGTGTSKPMLGEGVKNYAVDAMKANPVGRAGTAAAKIAPTAPNAAAGQVAASLKKTPALAKPGAGMADPAGRVNRLAKPGGAQNVGMSDSAFFKQHMGG